MKKDMSLQVGKAPGLVKVACGIGIMGIIVAGLLFFGRGTGLSARAKSLLDLGQAIWARRSVLAYSRGDFTNVIFLHHSTGANLIDQGKVREALTAAGIDFWDQDYNDIGLRDPAGRYVGYAYRVPGDNTDIDGLAVVFAQTPYSLPVNALSGLLQHEVIVVKSCFPNSNIASDAQLEQDKADYRSMRATMDRYPQRLFIIVTQPPLNPTETNLEKAGRARALAKWLVSDEFVSGHPNVRVFDFFDYLAESDPSHADINMLKEAYRDGADSHPNRQANEQLGQFFSDFIVESIRGFRSANQ